MHAQVSQATKLTFDETITGQRKLLATARTETARLTKNGVRGIDRDFSDYVDVSLSALDLLEGALGPRLRRSWSSL